MSQNTNLNNILNAESISVEVALEILGQSMQPLRNALNAELSRENASPELIAYYEQRLQALKDLQQNLPDRQEIIQQILDPSDKLFRV